MGAKFPSAKENQFQKTFILPCVILAMCPNPLTEQYQHPNAN